MSTNNYVISEVDSCSWQIISYLLIFYVVYKIYMNSTTEIYFAETIHNHSASKKNNRISSVINFEKRRKMNLNWHELTKICCTKKNIYCCMPQQKTHITVSRDWSFVTEKKLLSGWGWGWGWSTWRVSVAVVWGLAGRGATCEAVRQVCCRV